MDANTITEGERWGDIPGHPSYKVSTTGRVWSKHINDFKKPQRIWSGYHRIQLWEKGVAVRFYVHRLVLLVFVGPCPEGLEAAHLDGDKSNNCLDNLLYTTRSENMLMKRRHGSAIAHLGEYNPQAKLTNERVKSIRSEYVPNMEGKSLSALAKKHGVSPATIWFVIHNKTWTHI